MPVTYKKTTAVLAGVCAVEEAEGLLDWLRRHPAASLDLGRCEHLHTAVLQVLLALKPALRQPPADPWLRSILETGGADGPQGAT